MSDRNKTCSSVKRRQCATWLLLGFCFTRASVPKLWEPDYWLAELTRQTVFPTSSAIKSAPVLSIASPTGRPRAFPFASRKSVTNILRFAIGPAAAEGHENDPVTVEDRPVPATVFADEGAATIFLRQTVALLIELVVDLGVN